MIAKLRRWWRESTRRQNARKDEVATDKFLLEHEQADRERSEPSPLPPGRTNTDWTYIPPP